MSRTVSFDNPAAGFEEEIAVVECLWYFRLFDLGTSLPINSSVNYRSKTKSRVGFSAGQESNILRACS